MGSSWETADSPVFKCWCMAEPEGGVHLSENPTDDLKERGGLGLDLEP